MERSEQINELATALAKAQAKIKNAEKGSKNPHFKQNYADLAAVWDACRFPLTENGLSIVQPIGYYEGKVLVETILMHTSGQWILSKLILTPRDQNPQSIGSAVTYGRRFSLAAMVGVAPEEKHEEPDHGDDDGNAANEPSPQPIRVLAPQAAVTLPKPDAPKTEWHPEEKHLKALFATAGSSGWTSPDCKAWLKGKFNIDSSKLMNRTQFDEMIEFIKKNPKHKPETLEPLPETHELDSGEHY